MGTQNVESKQKTTMPDHIFTKKDMQNLSTEKCLRYFEVNLTAFRNSCDGCVRSYDKGYDQLFVVLYNTYSFAAEWVGLKSILFVTYQNRMA